MEVGGFTSWLCTLLSYLEIWVLLIPKEKNKGDREYILCLQ